MQTQTRWIRPALGLVLLVYAAIAVQYARLTPAWQAPDEPAHYNYARYVAEYERLPVLETGDFPYSYLEEIKARGFPPEMSIDSIRYESWQPPLYYLLGAAVLRLAPAGPPAQQLLALRLLSVALGVLLLAVIYRATATFAPGRPWLALSVTALAATIPMHIAVTASASNDVLAEIWVGLLLWQLLALLRQPAAGLRRWLLLGVTLGLAGLTKISTFVTVPLILAVLGYVTWQGTPASGRARALAGRLGAVAIPALLLMLPWLANNVNLYGLGDPFAFARHDAVVLRQERTVDWLRQVGPRQALLEFLSTTFHSFWGQFGWMGVPIDSRLYLGLGVLTGLAVLGLGLRLPSLGRDWRKLDQGERAGLLLLAGAALLVGASLIWYNLTFKQHQGRYLFPGLVPIGVFLCLGWREIARRAWRPLLAGVVLAAALLLAGRNLLRHSPLDKWTLAGMLGLTGGAGLASWVPERWSRWLYALPYPLLLLLDVACLYAFILPALA